MFETEKEKYEIIFGCFSFLFFLLLFQKEPTELWRRREKEMMKTYLTMVLLCNYVINFYFAG